MEMSRIGVKQLMETNLPLEKIIETVTREVMRELGRRGIYPVKAEKGAAATFDPTTSARLDMGSYKTPIVTENALNRLHERTVTVIVPAGAIITPRAKELMRERNISVAFE
jgi:hypothetical protein